MPNLDNETILLAVAAVTALAMLLQTIFLLVITVTVRKTARSLHEEAEELRSSVMPIVYNTRELITRLTPKIESTIEDLAEVSQLIRVQSAAIQSSTSETLDRLNKQSLRLDATLTSFFDAADRAGSFVAESVNKPIRQFNGFMASIKAVVGALRGPAQRHSHERPPADDSVTE